MANRVLLRKLTIKSQTFVKQGLDLQMITIFFFFVSLLAATLKSCLEKVECFKEDEFQFTSPEFAEGIPPFACEFAFQPHLKHLLAAADEDGQVSIYDTNLDGQGALIKGIK